MLLAAPSAPAAAEEGASPAAPSTPATIFSPERVIVQWEAGADRSDRVEARESAEVSSLRLLGDPAFQLVRVDAGQSIGDALAALRDDSSVQVAERDSYGAPNALPDDPLLDQLWGLQNAGLGIAGFTGALAGADIDAPGAWSRTVGTPSTVIADLDSGYRFDSPDLGPVAWTNPADPPGGGDDDGNGIVDDSHGADFVGPSANSPAVDGDPTDDDLIDGGHGVHTAGTMGAAGNDGIGITGVAQDVRIMPLRVCSYFTDPTPTPTDDSGSRCPTSSQIQAINYAAAHGARVANMSLGSTSFSTAARNAIAANSQILFVISAGNDGEDNDSVPHYPCNYNPLAEGKSSVDNVVCVAATDQADQLAGFSDWGQTSVDLGAPGTETLSTYPAKVEHIDDDYETDDFSTAWANTGGEGFGRASPGDGPLTSFGMSDSPNEAPKPGSEHIVTLASGVPVPVGTGPCRLSALRYRDGGTGGTFFYAVLSDGSPVFTNFGSAKTSGSKMTFFQTGQIDGLAGHSVQLSFGFTAGSSPTAANGIWLDEVKLTCQAPLSTPPGYAFLQGTSMAAPHVTGAAGLLFSLKPSATVTEVRSALLESVDPVSSLSGVTATGGRLNAARAIDLLESPGKVVVDELPPGAVAAAEAGATTSAATIKSRALPSCTVPKLAGKTLAKAKVALAAAGCRLGKVSKPKTKKGLGPLVVRSSRPGRGTKAASGKVDLTLGPKPKPRKRRH